MTTQNIFLPESDWLTLKEKLKDPLFEALHLQNEKAVDCILETGEADFWNLPEDLRDKTSKPIYPGGYRIFRHKLYRSAVSWRITGREDSLREALRTVDHMLMRDEWHTAKIVVNLSHGDLRTADIWVNACFALEALAPALGNKRKQALVDLLTEWALPAYLRGIEEGDWWRRANFNWGAALHGGAGMAALCVKDLVPDLSANVLEEVKDGLRFVIANLPQGGGWTEGLMYQTTTLGHLTDFVAALLAVTGDDLGLRKNPRLHDNLHSRPWMIGGDLRHINFSDTNEKSDEWRLPHGWWWADQCGHPEWAGFEAAFPRAGHYTGGVFLDVELFWFRKPFQEFIPWQSPTGLWHSRDLDWLSWKQGKCWLAFRSGFNGGNHNNRDLGQMVFGFGEERILIDPGYGKGETRQHSCIDLSGNSQGLASTAKLFTVETYTAGDRQLLYLCCDLSDVYSHKINFHFRHVLVDSRGMLVVFDDLRGKQNIRLGAAGHLQLSLQPRSTPEGSYSLDDSPNSAYNLHFFPGTVAAETREWKAAGTVHTLCYKSKKDANTFRKGFVLHPDNLPPPEIELLTDTNQLKISQATHQVHINLDEGFCRIRDPS
jgi:hypothetical protein